MRRPRDDDDPDEDDEFDLPEGVYHDDGDDGAVACPHCGESVYEGAAYCPRCENYISKEDAPRDGKPAWVWVCLVLALGVAVLWALG